MMGVCAGGRTNCVGMGTMCVQDVAASTEVCDALDNDCDGMVDEGTVCPGVEVCAMGNCVPPCGEGFCAPTETCDTSGLCIDTDCLGVTCPPDQRCDDGVCVGACDGVVCPFGQECRSGACIDLCMGITCDSCTVCVAGACVSRCEYTPCPMGETCQADGTCLADACLAVVPCAPGFHCEAGTCVDSCIGATCPTGQVCDTGACVPAPPGSDAGTPPGTDGGFLPGTDGGAGTGPDAGDAGTDSGFGSPRYRAGCGCGCSVAGEEAHEGASPAGLAALLLLPLLVVARRRRR